MFNTMGKITKEDLVRLSRQMTRFTVPQKIRINEKFLNKLIEDGAIKEGDGIPPFSALPVEIDNTIATYEFDY